MPVRRSSIHAHEVMDVTDPAYGKLLGRLVREAGPDGVLMVDTQFATLTDRIVEAIREISTEPIKFALNTQLHGDHLFILNSGSHDSESVTIRIDDSACAIISRCASL